MLMKVVHQGDNLIFFTQFILMSKGLDFYCLAVEAGFYSGVVECLPVDPATWVQFPARAGKIFSLYDNGAQRK